MNPKIFAARGPKVVQGIRYREAILGLLRIRDFLGLQLDHAWGNVSEEDFDIRAVEYLKRRAVDPADLQSQVEQLNRLLSTTLSAETIADIFQCELDEAEKSLGG